MKISRFSFLWLLVIMACDTNVDFDGVEYPIEPVVYAHLNADSTVEARVMHTAPVKGDFSSDRGIDDARVVLIENGEDSTLLELTPEGRYKANYIPNIESQYSLWVETNYGNMLSSSIQIPDQPKLEEIDMEGFQKGYFDYTDLITAKLNIEGALPQFFSVQGGSKDANRFQSIRIIPFSDEIISSCGGFDGSNGAALYAVEDLAMSGIQNECLESGSLLLELVFNRENLPENTNHLLLKFAATSPEYHEFETNLIEYRAIDLFFEEPLPPYSNFDFGYGYFAAFNEVEVELSL